MLTIEQKLDEQNEKWKKNLRMIKTEDEKKKLRMIKTENEKNKKWSNQKKKEVKEGRGGWLRKSSQSKYFSSEEEFENKRLFVFS